MKKWIIASKFSLFFIVIFGCTLPIVPIVTSFTSDRLRSDKIINEPLLIIFVCLLAAAVTTVLVTVIAIGKHANTIDNLEKEEIKVQDKQNRLNILIKKYNDLIAKENGDESQKVMQI